MSPDDKNEREPALSAVIPEQPEETAETVAESPEGLEDSGDPGQTVRARLNQALYSSREANADTRLLAQSMDYTRHVSEENGTLDETRFSANLNDVLRKWIPDENKRAEAAAEIAQFEKTLVAHFRSQIEAQTAPEQKTQVSETIAAVRESLYCVVINGLLSGKKVADIIGSVNYSKTPGAEVTAGGAFSPNDFCAYFKIGQDGRADVFVYEKLLTDQNKPHIGKHELGHSFAEASNLWQNETYGSFLRCAASLNQQEIDALRAQAPELAEILEALKNPDSHAKLWNGYIQKRFAAMKNLANEEISKERVAVAREMVAEMIAPYLDSAGSTEGYLAAKLQFTNPDQLHSFLLNTSGCKNDEQLQAFCQSRGVNLEQVANGDDLLREFSKVDEFRSFFRLCSLFKVKLDQDFASIENAGDSRQSDEFFAQGIGEKIKENDFGFTADDSVAPGNQPKNKTSQSGEVSEEQKTITDSLLDWVMPKKKTPSKAI